MTRLIGLASPSFGNELRVPKYEDWWDVPIVEVSGEASVNETREEYEKAIEKQRVVWR